MFYSKLKFLSFCFQILFPGTYYTVAIFEIGLAIAATCIVLNFYYSKSKMPMWLKSVLLQKLAPLFRVKLKVRRVSTMEGQLGIDTLQDHEAINNAKFEAFNRLDGGLGWRGVGDIFEHSENATLTSVNLKKGSDQIDQDEQNEMSKANSPGNVLNGIKNKTASFKGVRKPSNKETNRESEEPTRQQLIQWQEEWRAASQVLDRVMITFAIIIGFTSAAIIFLQAPRVRKMFHIS